MIRTTITMDEITTITIQENGIDRKFYELTPADRQRLVRSLNKLSEQLINMPSHDRLRTDSN